jgi:hypothetical protein
MRLVLDPDDIRRQIQLRRAATDMKLPMNERLKVHFITHRADLLSNFSLTAGAWMMLLHSCSADAANQRELETLRADVLNFKEWAQEGLQALQRMGLQESVADDERHMPDDPALVAAMRKMLGIQVPKAPGSS